MPTSRDEPFMLGSAKSLLEEPKACQTCKFRIDSSVDPSPRFWKCGIHGGYCESNRISNIFCGPSGKSWFKRPTRIPGIFELIWRIIFGYQPD